MPEKTTYEELERRVLELERKLADRRIVRDLSDRKAIEENEEKYRLMVEKANEAILVAQDSVFVFSNPKAEALFGYSEAELGFRPLTQFIHEADRKTVQERHEGRLAGDTSIPDVYPIRIFHKSGDIRWVDLKVSMFSWDDRPATLCFVSDITKQKQAEEVLRENQDKYRTLFEAANDAIFVACAETGVLRDANQQAEQLTGKRRHEIIGMHFSALHPSEQRSVAMRNFERDSKLKGENRYTDFVVQHADGREIPVQISPSIIQIQGKPCVLAIFRDVSEQKNAEDALRRSEENLKKSQVIAKLGNYQTDLKENAWTASDEFYRIFGLPKKEKYSQEDIQALVHPDDFDEVMAYFYECLREQKPFDYQYRCIKQDTGDVVYVQSYSDITFDEDGTPDKIFGVKQDITERRKAEIALRESEARFRLIFEQATAGIAIATPDGRFADVNQAFCDMLGYTRAELLRMTVLDVTFPEDRGLSIKTDQPIRAGKQDAYRLQKRYLHKDGRPVWADLSSSVIRDDDGNLRYAIGVVVDITDRRKSEEALRKSETRYRALFNHTQDAILIADDEGCYTDANPASCRLLGYSRDELLQLCLWDITPGATREQGLSLWRQFMEFGIQSGEYQTIRKDGTPLHVDYRAVANFVPGKHLSTMRDITDRKRAETALQKSLAEKEVLLREIHHRVKNNMQTIAGLLRMHSRRTDDAHLTEIFTDCRNRIGAMSLIHEALYQSDDLSRIDFAAYLKKLCRNLGQAHDARGRGVALTVSAADMALNMDQGVAVGMIIAELVSNAFKHAFPPGKGGTVAVHLDRQDAETVRLIVSDTGKGLPADIDMEEAPSLGLRLVSGAVNRDLGGTLAVERDGGTRFIIQFKCDIP